MRGSKPGEHRGGRKKGTRNKVTRELAEIAGEYTEEAIETLADIMRHGESEQVRAVAADKLLDRAHGKAAQSHVHKGDKDNPLEMFIGYRDEFRTKLVKFAQPRET